MFAFDNDPACGPRLRAVGVRSSAEVRNQTSAPRTSLTAVGDPGQGAVFPSSFGQKGDRTDISLGSLATLMKSVKPSTIHIPLV